MKVKFLAATVVASFLFSAPAFAGKYNNCSPGFWKNHTELWRSTSLACSTDEFCTLVFDALNARGPGSDVFRNTATNYLNNWADGYYGLAVCTE